MFISTKAENPTILSLHKAVRLNIILANMSQKRQQKHLIEESTCWCPRIKHMDRTQTEGTRPGYTLGGMAGFIHVHTQTIY